ncbi:ATP-dependent RNA helicase DeaD [Desulfosarcina sp. BuS5]|uniref:DEAD/DEAH box helicase n=1 Tax=Desulfosarcina sp. BuS5 TaxID=933262 RepID=UPI000483BD1B|nr:DEAD/DEAH box helicase [Desulfosarcina sp. BuS5]WDN89318.1 ATP-dependent RNA helicase DeaD [Desulfosarcina sp. BuS5]
MSFENLDLIDELLQAVNELGFIEPTPIQTDAIPEIIGGERDLVGLAQTGTGKTAAFGLPMIQLIDFDLKHTQGVVICPTRELCLQISADIKKLCKYVNNAKVAAVYGGASIETQRNQIKKGAQIIVATPGRLLDLINKKIAKLYQVSYLVLDEADEMLNMGFQEDIDAILKNTPAQKRTWLFSATMPHEVAKIAKKYMKNPVEITIGKKNSGAENIAHVNYIVKEKDRYQALKRIIDYYPDIYGLVFCRTRKDTQEVAEKLIKDNYNADALHGDLSQGVRDKVMGRFKTKSLQILIATDVAARGIDVQNITHVINYKLPDEAQNYTHRSGRTARAGKSGTSIAIINSREKSKLQFIQKKAGVKFNYAKVPEGYAICEKQLYFMINKMVEVKVDHKAIGRFLPPVYNTLSDLTKEELIQKFVSIEFNRFLYYYKGSKDINVSLTTKKDAHRPAKKRRQQKGLEPGKSKRFFLNKGSKDNLQKGAVIRTLCSRAGISSENIGAIEIMRECSFFEVETNVADNVLKSMKDAKIDGRKIQVEYAENKKSQTKRSKKSKKRKKR